MMYDALDDFAGPGGWDEGARLIGLTFLGNEWDQAACDTAEAAGHARRRVNVATDPSEPHRGIPGHVSSPPCTLFSAAGSGVGKLVIDVLATGIRRIFRGDDPDTVRTEVRAAILPVTTAEAEAKNETRAPEKRRTAEQVREKAERDAFVATLVLEPARRIIELNPEWFALEQVPEVLPLWQVYARETRALGYSTYAVVLNAADYGVPQTRRRAIAAGSRVRAIAPPPPTHAEHPQDEDLFGGSLQPWVSFAEAMGWGPEKPARTVTGGGGSAGGAEIFPNADFRARLREYVVDRRTNSKAAGGGMAPTVPVPVTRPAPTLTGRSGQQWQIRPPEWTTRRPATTVVGSFRPDVIAAPGYRTEESRQDAPGSVVVTVAEAGVLQSFRPDYPWTGNKGKQYEQAGNAVPPLLAAHVLAATTGRPAP